MSADTPREGDRPAWVPEALFPFESRFVEVAGTRVHYVDEGEGPLLLMLHGNPTWSFVYGDVIRELRDRFHCVALDYPGFGMSRAPAGYGFRPEEHARVVAAFVEALGLDGLVLVANDWGGPIGLWVAGQRPTRFRALVLGNTWAWPVNGDFHFEWFSWLMGGPPGRWHMPRFNTFVRVLIPVGLRRKRLSAMERAAYRGPFPTPESREPTRVFPEQITAGQAFLAEVEAGLERLSHVPVLILWPDGDIAFRARERKHFEAAFPRHETRILRRCGHFIQEDAPAEVAAAIRDWYPQAVG